MIAKFANSDRKIERGGGDSTIVTNKERVTKL